MSPQQTDPLANLADIDTSIGLGLQMPWGWWLLLLIVITLFIGFYRWYKKTHQHRLNKTYILQALLALRLSKHQNKVVELSILLRRYAHYQFKDLSINSLGSTEWVQFLDQQVPLADNLKQLLLNGMYQKNTSLSDLEAAALFDYANMWVKNV